MGEVWHFPHAAPIRRGNKTLIMGIINMTPDSFSGQNASENGGQAVDLALEMLQGGADCIDIGAESSRPGATPLTAEEEMKRLGDIVQRLRKQTTCPISVDTYHPATAAFALSQGADIINDITALRGGWEEERVANREMASLIAESGAHAVLMHMPCSPGKMREEIRYPQGVVETVRGFLAERVQFAVDMGIGRERLWLDPGYGFGKNFRQNSELLIRQEETRMKGLPILAGLSRKRIVGESLRRLGEEDDKRLEGSIALAVMARMNGAEMVRVHDVGETARALAVIDAVSELDDRRKHGSSHS